MISSHVQPKILCVDDHKVYCETVAEYLREIPADVVTATNGNDAIRRMTDSMFSGRPFDLVVLDMQVPRGIQDSIDTEFGIQLLIAMRSRKLIPMETPILIYTQYGDSEKRETCIRNGAADFILKSDPDTQADNVDVLVSRCRQLLSGDSQVAVHEEVKKFSRPVYKSWPMGGYYY